MVLHATEGKKYMEEGFFYITGQFRTTTAGVSEFFFIPRTKKAALKYLLRRSTSDILYQMFCNLAMKVNYRIKIIQAILYKQLQDNWKIFLINSQMLMNFYCKTYSFKTIAVCNIFTKA